MTRLLLRLALMLAVTAASVHLGQTEEGATAALLVMGRRSRRETALAMDCGGTSALHAHDATAAGGPSRTR